MDVAKKQDLLDKHAEKYKTMDTAKKQDLLDKHAEKYKTITLRFSRCLKTTSVAFDFYIARCCKKARVHAVMRLVYR